jgi:flagellar assembly protein FliH
MSNVIKLNSKGVKLNVKGFVSAFGESQVDNQENNFKQLLEEHYSKGYEDGRKEAYLELESGFTEKLAKKFTEFHNIISNYDDKMLTYESAFEKVVLDTAFAIAEKIVKREIEKESIISDVLRTSIKKILGANEVVIKLNPNDYDSLMSDAQQVLAEHSYSKIKFEPEENIEAGGCLIETEIGNVDSRISTQLESIKQNLDASLNPQ